MINNKPVFSSVFTEEVRLQSLFRQPETQLFDNEVPVERKHFMQAFLSFLNFIHCIKIPCMFKVLTTLKIENRISWSLIFPPGLP